MAGDDTGALRKWQHAELFANHQAQTSHIPNLSCDNQPVFRYWQQKNHRPLVLIAFPANLHLHQTIIDIHIHLLHFCYKKPRRNHR